MTTFKLLQSKITRSTTIGLPALLGCCILQAQAMASGSLSNGKLNCSGQSQKDSDTKSSQIDPDYYQSSDNPLRAD